MIKSSLGYLIIIALIGTSGASYGAELNNPGNIRHGDKWVGMTDNRTYQFVQYQHQVYGYRAMARILSTYQGTYNIRCVHDIIYRYAPPTENPTEQYSKFVSSHSGFTQTQVLDLNDPAVQFKLIKAMTRFEQGADYHISDGLIERGIRLARTDGN